MQETRTVELRRIIEVAAGDDEHEVAMWRALRELADELNDALADLGIVVRLVHEDTDDLLEFAARPIGDALGSPER